MKIVADNTIPFLKGIAEPEAEVSYLPAKGFTPEAIQEADALIVRSIDKCTPELLAGSPVKLITTATIGFDHIDTHYCDAHGIAWKNAPGCNAPSVAQYLFSSLLTIALRRGERLEGKTLGIVGVGHVGKEVEKLAENDYDIERLAGEADIITLHVPFTKEGKYPTYHLADAGFFRKVRKGCWFVNSCRGAVHDTRALLEAKSSGIFSEIILDCWENEPDVDRELLNEVSIATPHIAGFSADGKAMATRMCLEEIERFFGIRFSRLPEVVPSAPLHPIIDLDEFADYRVERAFLRTFNPEPIDHQLRREPASFEYLRNHYAHPREPKAYQVVHARPEERDVLKAIGFTLS